MVARLKGKANHPFYNKNHSTEIKNLISKKAELNPTAPFTKSHLFEAKKLISLRQNLYPLGVNVYGSTGLFLGQFNSNTEIAKALNIHKSTVSH